MSICRCPFAVKRPVVILDSTTQAEVVGWWGSLFGRPCGRFAKLDGLRCPCDLKSSFLVICSGVDFLSHLCAHAMIAFETEQGGTPADFGAEQKVPVSRMEPLPTPTPPIVLDYTGNFQGLSRVGSLLAGRIGAG